MKGGYLFLTVLLLVRRAQSATFTITGASSGFQSISSSGTSVGLTFPSTVGGTYPTLSSFNNYNSLTSSLAFDFGATSFTIGVGDPITITANGDVFVGISSLEFAVMSDSSSGVGRFAVANCYKFAAGNVYYLFKASSLIVSYENMKFTSTSTDLINAQIEIYTNGRVEFRYGSTAVLPTGQVCYAGAADNGNVLSIFTHHTFDYGACSDGTCTAMPSYSGWMFSKFSYNFKVI